MSADVIIRNEASLKDIGDELAQVYKVEYGQIPVDFVIYTSDKPLMIERKTTSDFKRSIADKSLWNQLYVMKETTDANKRFILIEGSLAGGSSWGKGWSKGSIIGVLRSIEEDYDVNIIQMPNIMWSKDWLGQKIKKYKFGEKKRDYALRSSASRKLSTKEKAKYILNGFPELGGGKLPQEIMEKTINFEEFISWILIKKNVDFSARIQNLRNGWLEILMEGWK